MEIQRRTADAIDGLKKSVDQVRLLLGQKAVDKLMTELPAAAVKALKDVQGDLPVEAGQSPFLTFKQKRAQLVKKELEARDTINRFQRSGVFGSYDGVWNPEKRTLHSDGNNLKALQNFSDRAAMVAANPNSTSQDQLRWEGSARKAKQRLDDGLRLLDPSRPAEDFVVGLYGAGPGKRAIMDVVHDLSRMATLESQRTRVEGYAQLAREVGQLERHLAQAGVANEDQVMALKAEMFADSVPVEKLHKQVITLLGELVGVDGSGGMTDSSTIKKEIARGTHQSVQQTSGSSYGSTRNYDAYGTPSGSSYTSTSHDGRTVTKGSSTQEILRPEARTYTVIVAPDVQNTTDRVAEHLSGHNAISKTELTIFADRLLAARRIYEAMVMREPDSPYTAALKSWMEETDFAIKEVSADQYGGPTSRDLTGLSMGDLRPRLLEWNKLGRYPDAATAVVKEELALGPARKEAGLSSLSSLSSL